MSPTPESTTLALPPMLATSGSRRDLKRTWSFEIKWDGVRAMARFDPEADPPLMLFGRRSDRIDQRYPELATPPFAQPLLLDGEIIAADQKGLPSFARLQRRMHKNVGGAELAKLAREVPVVFMAFDLLERDGQPLIEEPYDTRRARLEALSWNEQWQLTLASEDGPTTFEAITRLGMEGLIAKDPQSPYRPGQRSDRWLKIKHRPRQEFVIAGWTPMVGHPNRLGALLVGYHDGDGQLRYAGKVGTGMTNAARAELKQLLTERSRRTSPFSAADRKKLPREAKFARPELVGEIAFAEWTPTGMLRQPSLQGLRNDKPAARIVRET